MQQKETLSAYMDGQANGIEFADTLTNSPELKAKWASYHMIRNVMQGEEVLLNADFSTKMETLLENETIESIQEKPRGLMVKLKRWVTPIMQAGIAASVCLVALVGVNIMNSSEDVAQTEPTLQTIPFSNAVQAVSYNAPSKDLVTPEKLEQQQHRLDSLLQNYEIQRRTQNVTLTDEEKAKAQTSSTVTEKHLQK